VEYSKTAQNKIVEIRVLLAAVEINEMTAIYYLLI